jgi:hypothetical protein
LQDEEKNQKNGHGDDDESRAARPRCDRGVLLERGKNEKEEPGRRVQEQGNGEQVHDEPLVDVEKTLVIAQGEEEEKREHPEKQKGIDPAREEEETFLVEREAHDEKYTRTRVEVQPFFRP